MRQQGARLAFAAPPLTRSGPADAELRSRVAAVLRLPEDAVLRLLVVDDSVEAAESIASAGSTLTRW